MIHSHFVEILTVGLFVAFYFNWFKIYVRAKLWARAFIRNHIADRVDPDIDLNFTPGDKVQPTGTEIETLCNEMDQKFILHGKVAIHINQAGTPTLINWSDIPNQ